MIDIGKVIYKRLSDNGITSYPIVAPENSTLPLVIYERNFNYQDSKDGISNSNSSVDIFVVTADYKEGITLANTIDDILLATNGTVSDINVIDVDLMAGAEIYAEGIYIQKITYNLKTRK